MLAVYVAAAGFVIEFTVKVARVEFAKVQLLFNVIVIVSVVVEADKTPQPAPANPEPSVTVGDAGTPVKDVGHWTVIVLPDVAENPVAKVKPIVHVDEAVACNDPGVKETPTMTMEAVVLSEKLRFVSSVKPADDDWVVLLE